MRLSFRLALLPRLISLLVFVYSCLAGKGESMSKNRTTISRSLALSLLFTGTAALALVAPSAVHAATTGTVQGIIRGENGLPLSHVRVFLVGAGTPPQARTDKSGYYTFSGVVPGAYIIRVQLAGYETTQVSVQVLQDQTANIDVALAKAVLRRRGIVLYSPITRNDTSVTIPITKLDEQREKSQPDNLYVSTGLLNYKPGVTTDAGQYPHLRGSAQNQIDYLVDGISVRDPVFNEFQTNLVTVGIQTSNVQTAGQDASYGGATGGYLNQITSNGRDLKGGTIEGTLGPAHLWRYKGNRFEYGNITSDQKFDYAITNLNYQTYYGANTQNGKLNSSTDSQIKLNYYGAGNTFTLYAKHGAEDFWTYDSTNPGFSSGVGLANGETYKFGFNNKLTGVNPTTHLPITYSASLDTHAYALDHTLQTDNEVYGQIRHNFTTASYLAYRYFNQHQHTPTHSENVNGFYADSHASRKGNELIYHNEINRNIILHAGYLGVDDGGSAYNAILSPSGVFAPLDATNSYYINRIYGVRPLENTVYASTTYKTTDNKFTTDIGLRYSNMKYRTQTSAAGNALYSTLPGQSAPPDAYTTHYLDPRFGLNYSPDRLTKFNTSYAVNSQMPETRYIGFATPLENNFPNTALDPAAQFTQTHTDRLPFNRLKPYHSNDFDLGVQRAFLPKGLLAGAYTVGVTGYKKKQYDIIEVDQPTFDLAGNPKYFLNLPSNPLSNRTAYTNDGHAHASGVELTLRKTQVHPSDWSGYINYTNQVVRSNSDFVDTGYRPYFYNSLQRQAGFYDSRSGNPNHLASSQDFRRLNNIEFPTGYDQRHTVAVVIHKSFFKFLDSTFILDAGSGYPYFTGAPVSDGAFGGADSQHGELSRTLAGSGTNLDFTEVPFTAGIGGGGSHANPLGVIAGRSSWHYNVSINTTFHLTSTTGLFLNVDNVFDKKTVTNYGSSTFSGQPYFSAPTAAFPQGKVVYGPQTVLTPIFLTVGFQQKF